MTLFLCFRCFSPYFFLSFTSTYLTTADQLLFYDELIRTRAILSRLINTYRLLSFHFILNAFKWGIYIDIALFCTIYLNRLTTLHIFSFVLKIGGELIKSKILIKRNKNCFCSHWFFQCRLFFLIALCSLMRLNYGAWMFIAMDGLTKCFLLVYKWFGT